MNYYRRGANAEREIVNRWASRASTVLAGRFASSKCKGKMRADVIVLTDRSLYLIQVKKGKQGFAAEKRTFNRVPLPRTVKVTRQFITIKPREGKKKSKAVMA